MTDDELESSLQRFQVRGPASNLRARALAAAATAVTVPLAVVDWSLMAAAAALLLVVAWPDRAASGVDPAQAVNREQLEDVAEGLGGGDDAWRLAAVVIAAEPKTSNETTDEEEAW